MSFSKPVPKVTIVTVVLNAVDLIERTVQSVVAQDYPALEYVVVDGVSTDGTLQLLQRHGPGISTLVSEKDGGIYAAMNKGAALASGEWILFMNAGDFFVRDDVVSRVFAAATATDADVIYGDSIYVYESYKWLEKSDEHVTLHDGLGFCHQSAFVRTSVQREFGFDVTEKVAADYDFALRLKKAGRSFRKVDVVVAEFLTGGFSALAPAATIRLRHRVYKKHFDRGNAVLYVRLARLWVKTTLKAMVPARAWDALKRMRDQGRALPEPHA
jgi:glycosyltransferase involved in cell wall biosynthesis